PAKSCSRLPGPGRASRILRTAVRCQYRRPGTNALLLWDGRNAPECRGYKRMIGKSRTSAVGCILLCGIWAHRAAHAQSRSEAIEAARIEKDASLITQ